MGLLKLVHLRTKEDNLKKQTSQWRQIIYQACSTQAKQIINNPSNLSPEHLKQQQQFFNRKLRNYMQGLKDSQVQLQSIQTQIKEYQNHPTVKVLKFIDFYGLVIILSIITAGILSIIL